MNHKTAIPTNHHERNHSGDDFQATVAALVATARRTGVPDDDIQAGLFEAATDVATSASD